jgi:hypothetical protein
MIDIEKLVGQVSKEIKKGSTRLVYFPINSRKIILDGIEVKIDTVLKIVKSHTLEINSDECFLGKFQNKIECQLNDSKYSLFLKNTDGSYTTNYNGILTPIIAHNPDYFWEEMIRVFPMTIRDFCLENTTENYPAGLYFPDAALCMHKWFCSSDGKGGIYPKFISDEKYDIIMNHPWIKLYISLLIDKKLMPQEFTLENLGYIIHPISGKKIIVISDYGCTEEYMQYLQEKQSA